MYGVVHGPLAGRIPIVLSTNPWILGLGILFALIFIVYHASKKNMERKRLQSLGSEQTAASRWVFQEVEQLLAQPRYREAMQLLAEDSQQEADQPLERALDHLEQRGVDRDTASLVLQPLCRFPRRGTHDATKP